MEPRLLCPVLSQERLRFTSGWGPSGGSTTSWLTVWVLGSSLAVQWLAPRAVTAEGPGLIPGQRTKMPQAVGCSQKKFDEKKVWALEAGCLV